MRKFIKKNKFLRFAIKPFVLLFRGVVKLLILFLSFIEAPIFLLTHPHIFKNDLIYVFWMWSFGHSVSGLDYASRLYYPHRISLIFLPHPSLNPLLPLCFQHNLDVFFYKSLIPPLAGFDSAKYGFLRFLILFLSGLTGKFHVIEQFHIYKTLSIAEDRFLVGNEKTHELESIADWTGYIRLLREGIGKKPQLPNDLTEMCRNAIVKQAPDFFSCPFVTLFLREKGKDGELSSAFRCAGPHENYVSAVKYLTKNGYHVVGAGETDHRYFKNIKGYFSFEKLDIPKPLLNLFLLMHCVLFIGQQSGAFVLPNSCGIFCLICDAMPYRLGTFCSKDIILFKHLRERLTAQRLSIVEVFTKHEDLVYGMNFDTKNIAIEPNSPEEILEAVKECHAILQGQLKLSEEDKRLAEAFLKLPSRNMHLRYHGNRTSLYMLRQLRHELIKN